MGLGRFRWDIDPTIHLTEHGHARTSTIVRTFIVRPYSHPAVTQYTALDVRTDYPAGTPGWVGRKQLLFERCQQGMCSKKPTSCVALPSRPAPRTIPARPLLVGIKHMTHVRTLTSKTAGCSSFTHNSSSSSQQAGGEGAQLPSSLCLFSGSHGICCGRNKNSSSTSVLLVRRTQTYRCYTVVQLLCQVKSGIGATRPRGDPRDPGPASFYAISSPHPTASYAIASLRVLPMCGNCTYKPGIQQLETLLRTPSPHAIKCKSNGNVVITTAQLLKVLDNQV